MAKHQVARPRRRKQRYHHGHLARALLDATLTVAAERGATAVTLREAARTAGVTQTAVYRHFTNKQEMLAAASQEGFELLHRTMSDAIAVARSDSVAQLCALGDAYLRFALDRPAYFRLMYGHGSPPKSATPGLQHAANAAFQVFFEAVQRSLPPDAGMAAARTVASRVWAFAHGVATLALERQVLFVGDVETLARETRDALADLLSAS